MSVHGEFQRVLGAFVEFLEASEARASHDEAAALRAIQDGLRAAPAGAGLEHAAERVLERCGDVVDRVGVPRASEREQLDANAAHLAALCRAILGRGGEG